jgi:hypothetical protein
MDGEPYRPGPGEGRAGGNNPQAVLATLPPGWHLVGRSQSRPAGVGGGCYVLAHASRGVALVDVAPDATPSAESRLRRCLAATGFVAQFPGTLPVAHVRVEPTGLALVQPLLEDCFNAQPRLGIVDPGWVTALARTLEAQPAWSESASSDRPGLPAFLPEDLPRRRGSRTLRWGLAGLALAATFVAGLVLGVHTTANLPPPNQAVASVPMPVLAEAPPAAAPVAVSQTSPEAIVPAAPPTPEQPTSEPAAPAEEPKQTEAALPQTPAPQPLLSETPVPETPAPATEPQEPVPPQPATRETVVEAPRPPEAPRVRQTSVRRHLAIDPDCAQAVLRYQQGLPLSWSQMEYVRNGCRTVVR